MAKKLSSLPGNPLKTSTTDPTASDTGKLGYTYTHTRPHTFSLSPPLSHTQAHARIHCNGSTHPVLTKRRGSQRGTPATGRILTLAKRAIRLGPIRTAVSRGTDCRQGSQEASAPIRGSRPCGALITMFAAG